MPLTEVTSEPHGLDLNAEKSGSAEVCPLSCVRPSLPANAATTAPSDDSRDRPRLLAETNAINDFLRPFHQRPRETGPVIR
jgi:hypothetical protein